MRPVGSESESVVEHELTARHLLSVVESAVRHFRVVLIHGPRQSGKTTLSKLVADKMGGTYWSLEDDATRSAVLDDPLHYLADYPTPVVLDEIQQGGDRVVKHIKMQVDENPTPGRFLITGSTNFLTVPTISESLAGRVAICDLWPLSAAELTGTAGSQVHKWFDAPFGWDRRTIRWEEAPSRNDYFRQACLGGYPEAATLTPPARQRWFDGYLRTVTARDIMALSGIRSDADLNALMVWAAAATGQELNIAPTAQKLGISPPTLRSYLEWLETVRLVHRLWPWSRNHVAKAAKRPKLHVTDTGLVAALLGIDSSALSSPSSTISGALLESFVVNEVTRQLSAADYPRVRLSQFRDRYGRREVDLVLEQGDGSMIAMEVKATSSPAGQHVETLKWLRDRMDRVDPGSFKAGYLLHTGKTCLTISDRIHLRPIAALWLEPEPEQLPLP